MEKHEEWKPTLSRRRRKLRNVVVLNPLYKQLYVSSLQETIKVLISNPTLKFRCENLRSMFTDKLYIQISCSFQIQVPDIEVGIKRGEAAI